MKEFIFIIFIMVLSALLHLLMKLIHAESAWAYSDILQLMYLMLIYFTMRKKI
jgi:hypothetical protein